MAIGLFAVGLMVVYFGRFGDSIHGSYSIRVSIEHDGIYKGASVLLAGAKIGSVENNPVILPNMDGVYVNLRIYEEVRFPARPSSPLAALVCWATVHTDCLGEDAVVAAH
jgi:ABC-type transporter Mla subunit MlaD